MKIAILFNCFFLLSIFQSQGQNQDSLTIRKYYEQNTILWPGWTRYYKNNQSFPLRNLKNEINLSPDAIHEFALYRRNRTGLNVTMIAGTGLFVAALLVNDRQTKLGLLAASTLTVAISLPFSFSTSSHLSRAIWLHNRDIILR